MTTDTVPHPSTNNHIPQMPPPPDAWDSPPTRVSARARVTTTHALRLARLATAARTACLQWWVWVARPPSLRAVWRMSAVDRTRVPAESRALLIAWHWSNATDRLILFGLLLIAPTVVAGPLRWITARPTRRWAVYGLFGVVSVAFRIASERS